MMKIIIKKMSYTSSLEVCIVIIVLPDNVDLQPEQLITTTTLQIPWVNLAEDTLRSP